jgi:hypothetical protein
LNEPITVSLKSEKCRRLAPEFLIYHFPKAELTMDHIRQLFPLVRMSASCCSNEETGAVIRTIEIWIKPHILRIAAPVSLFEQFVSGRIAKGSSQGR